MNYQVPSSSRMTNGPRRRSLDVSQQEQKQKERLEVLRKTKTQYDDHSEIIRKKKLQTQNIMEKIERLLSEISLTHTSQKFLLQNQLMDLQEKQEKLEVEIDKEELDLEVLMGMDTLIHRKHRTYQIQTKIIATCEKIKVPGWTEDESNRLMHQLLQLKEEKRKSLRAEKDVSLLVDSSNQRLRWIGDIDKEMKILETKFGSDK